MHLGQHKNGLTLTIETEDGIKASASVDIEKQVAQKPQKENMQRQLQKLGNTIYQCNNLDIDNGVEALFVPSSVLAELRRQAVEELNIAISNCQQTADNMLNNKVGVKHYENNNESINGANPTKRTLFYGKKPTYIILPTTLLKVSTHDKDWSTQKWLLRLKSLKKNVLCSAVTVYDML